MRSNRCVGGLAIATVLGVAVALSGSVQAQPLISESFDYAVGDLHGQNGGTGFAGAWVRTKRNPQVTAADNTWGTLVTSGNRLNSNAWSALTRPIGSTLSDAGLMSNGATLYFSYVMDILGQNLTNLDFNFALGTDIFEPNVYADRTNLVGGEGIGVSNITAGRIRGAYWQDNDGDPIAEKVIADTTLQLNATDNSRALIVGKIQWGGTDTDPELLTLYAPGPDLALGTPILHEWATPALNQSQFNSLNLQFKDSQPSIDEIRFGATAGDVLGIQNVPVPVVIPVPNGSFEELYKPGTAIPGLVAPGGWTQGVGPNCPIDSGQYDFSDGSSGTMADIAGWIGADRDGWIANGGTYGRDQTTGNLQGSVARQSAAPDGVHYYLSNGGSWGNAAGGLIVSDAPLATVEAGATYILSMLANGAATPIVLELLAGGVAVTPTSLVDPGLDPSEWREFSRTYDPASLAAFVGQDLTILLGVGRGATGTQSHFDSVQLTMLRADVIPEPATLSLLGLGALLALRRRRRSR